MVAGGLAWFANQRAQAQTRLAQSRQLAGEAERLVNTRPDVAILAGLQSLSLARGQSPKPSAGLITGMARITLGCVKDLGQVLGLIRPLRLPRLGGR
jgi:hypothetical protein